MIYVLGTGYVAQAFAKHFLINSIPHRLITRSEVLYTNPVNLSAFLATNRPSLLINAAGFTGKPNVDACEKHKLACLYGNAILPGFIGEICAAMKIPWVHISSGCIYSGDKRTRWTSPRPIDPDFGKVKEPEFQYEGYTENDIPNFTFRDKYCSYYSGSKAMGEELIAKYDNAYVCRLRMPFNEVDGPRNYLTKLATYEKLINCSNSITQIDEFVEVVVKLWDIRAPFGIYNITQPGSLSAYDIVEKLLKAGIRKKEPTWITMPEFMQLVQTPRSNCLLDSSKVMKLFSLRPVTDAIDTSIKTWIPAST